MIKRNVSLMVGLVAGVLLAHYVIYPQGKALVARMGQDLSLFVLSIILICVVGAGAALWYHWKENEQ